MKNFILIITVAFLSLNSFSQTTKNYAVDFVAADINGNTLHLFEILDEGKFVYINFFRVNCSIDNEHVGQSEAAFNFFGCNGGDVFFIGVNTGNNKSEVADYVNSNNLSYPVISGIDGTTVSTIFEDYDVQATSTFILIAPNDSIVEKNIWPVETSLNIIEILEGYGLAETVCTVGIDEFSNNGDHVFNLFPNPATDNIQLNIQLTDFNDVKLNMYNLVGKEILSQKIDNPNQILNIRDFPAGVYFITLLENDQPISTQKIIFQR